MSDDDVSSPLSAGLDVIRQAIGLRKVADENIGIAQKRYRLRHHRKCQFVQIFIENDTAYLDRWSLFLAPDKESAADSYNKVLQKKQELYMFFDVRHNTLHSM